MGCAALAVANQHFLVAADPSNAVSWHIFVYMGPLVRIIEFSVGVLAAKAFLANRSFVSDRLSATVLEVGLLAGIVVASVYYLQIANILRDYPAVHYWARMTSGTVLFAIAVYIFASNRGWLSQALSHPVLVRLGEISFAFYMSHQFILARTWRWSDAIGAPAASFLTIVLCLSVAYAIWRFVEAPARRLILSVGSDRPLAARAAQKSVAMPRS